MNANNPVSQNREVGFLFSGYPDETCNFKASWIKVDSRLSDCVKLHFAPLVLKKHHSSQLLISNKAGLIKCRKNCDIIKSTVQITVSTLLESLKS